MTEAPREEAGGPSYDAFVKPPRKPEDEDERLDALGRLDLLDTPAEERFDRITRLARKVFDAPIALVSLVDAERQWFKSAQGLNVAQTPRETSFCGHAILQDRVFVVEDAARDGRFADNPLVTGDPRIRFYAGYPLRTASGHRVGTLCVIDRRPRDPGEEELRALEDLGSLAEGSCSARRSARSSSTCVESSRRPSGGPRSIP
jgi:GAF domain-containing protein